MGIFGELADNGLYGCTRVVGCDWPSEAGRTGPENSDRVEVCEMENCSSLAATTTKGVSELEANEPCHHVIAPGNFCVVQNGLHRGFDGCRLSLLKLPEGGISGL